MSETNNSSQGDEEHMENKKDVLTQAEVSSNQNPITTFLADRRSQSYYRENETPLEHAHSLGIPMPRWLFELLLSLLYHGPAQAKKRRAKEADEGGENRD
jgi:hypothetical protein